MFAETPIVFEHGALVRSISRQEAAILRDWVRLERTVGAVRLVGLLGAALLAEAPDPIVLDEDLVHAMCDALVDEEFDDRDGLAALHDLCLTGTD